MRKAYLKLLPAGQPMKMQRCQLMVLTIMLIERNSKNTIENAKFSKVMLDEAGLKPPYLLVTSAFHMRRSLMIYKHAGMNVVPYPAHFLVGDGRVTFDKFLPDAQILAHWGYYVKEMIGYAVNYFQ
ncbi:MAG: YdcF family protein [Moraxellaceae bacterium]|nr:MAG: YdcF family protein [Moraxellaceae bacterium]